MLYNNCRELPIHNFFEISRTGDLCHLVKCGKKPDESVLQDKYLDIIDEYNSLLQSSKNGAISQQARYYIMNLRLMNLELLQEVISRSGITNEVRETAKRLKIKPENIGAYIAGQRNELSKIERELQSEPEAKNDAGTELEKTLTLLKENGFNFDRFTTPVIEFVFAINRLEEKAKHLQNNAVR